MTEAAIPVRRASLPAPVLMAFIAIGCAVLFALGVAFGARGWDIVILGLGLITGFTGLIPVVVDQGRPSEKRQILITLISAVYMLFLVLPVFTQYFLVNDPAGGMLRLSNMRPETVVAGQFVALSGLVSMLAGFYLPVGSMAASLLPRPSRDWSPQVTLAVAMLMIPLGWTIYLGSQYGLIPRSFGSGVLGSVALSIFFGISLLTLSYLVHGSRPAFLALLLVMPPTMAFNFFTGSKRLFLTAPFMIALSYIVVERRVRKTWVIAGFVTLVALYPIAEFYRQVVQEGYRLSAVQILSNPGTAISQISGFASSLAPGEYVRTGLEATGARLDGLGVLSAIVRDTPERVPYQKGWTLAQIVVSWIPRVLWPSKPTVTIGEWVAKSYGSGLDANPDNPTDVGPTWIGELYFNFGIAGVVFGMLLLGMIFRMLQDLLFRAGAPIPALLAAVVVLYSAGRTVQGAVNRPINGIIFNVVPIVLAHFAVRMFAPARRHPSTSFTDRNHGSDPA